MDQRSSTRRGALAARREHSKGDGNFPDTRGGPALDGETPEDRGIEMPEAVTPDRTRTNARRSSSARRDALKTSRSQGRSRARVNVPQAPKSSEKSARKASVARRAGAGKKRTGAAKSARPKTVRGSRAGRGT